ncbi:hypothetical protein BHE74_00011701 [Ensete ventricosum]|nr:hypothetical protein BHE74_00011701 [Ensete ventricosum]
MAQNAAAGTVLIVGDSISAGFGLDTSKGWVALLEQRLKSEGFDDKVVNASISGDTSAGGLARLPAALAEHKPQLVIIELGGNDGLRGQPPAQLQQNLASMIDRSKAIGAKVLLLGMQLPPNYGPRYTNAFAAVYGSLAEEKQVPLVPFFLEGIGGHPELMQADGLHPAVGAQGKWRPPDLEPLMSRPAWSLFNYQLIEPDEQLDLFACQEVRVHLVARQLELGGSIDRTLCGTLLPAQPRWSRVDRSIFQDQRLCPLCRAILESQKRGTPPIWPELRFEL